MRVLSELEPKNVFSFFEDICNVPHPSYKMCIRDRAMIFLSQLQQQRKLFSGYTLVTLLLSRHRTVLPCQ